MALKHTARFYLETITNLAWRDLKIRYKSPLLGFLWAFLTPLLLTLLFTFIFSVILKIRIPSYPLFLLCGLFPWSFFSLSLSTGTACIVDNAALLKKIWFPRIVIPVSVVVANLAIFLAALPILFIMLFLFSAPVRWSLVLLPFVIVLHTMLTLGFVLLFSSLHTYFRDVKYLVEILLVILFYLSPIFYTPEGLITGHLLDIYMLNPFACLISTYRRVLMAGQMPDLCHLSYLAVASGGIFLAGLQVFRGYQADFADVV